jgi:hypothetical protein
MISGHRAKLLFPELPAADKRKNGPALLRGRKISNA